MKDFSIIFNRLKKNQQRLKSYLRQNNLEAFRLYDKDIPEYPYIIDVYGERVVIYEKGKRLTSNDQDLRTKHLGHIKRAINELYPHAQLYIKTRERQQGKSQYEKLNRGQANFKISEGNFKFLINLDDYLDSGLFLDHRPLRKILQKISKEKRVLNLFCYTASLSVAAAKGGGLTTNVDMSNTYLNWAKENFKLNGLSEAKHDFVRADILTWLQDHKEMYDLILLDPPSFSNSKKMEESFNIQEDQEKLIFPLMKMLAPQGLLMFSNNFRKFNLSEKILEEFHVRDATKETIPPDFRDQKIHHSFEIKNKKPL